MKKRLFEKIVISFVALAVVFVFDFWLFSPRDISRNEKQPENKTRQIASQDNKDVLIKDSLGKENQIDYSDVPLLSKEESEEEIKSQETETFQPKINLSVPFVSQSPFGKWDDTHNEACEEASLIIADYWLKKQELTKEKADKIILSAVKWQEENWGGHYDLNVLSTINLAKEYFGIKKIYYTLVNNINDVKRETSKGNLVLAPMAGRILDNKYYRSPGPAYHMLVVKGYNQTEIITNDPGTKKGEDFKYTYSNFLEAIHDWPFNVKEKKELDKQAKAIEILKGEKVIIVIEPDN